MLLTIVSAAAFCLTHMTPCLCYTTQEHYPAVDRDKVKAVMSDMVQAGRLQHVLNNPSLVRMGGVIRKLEEQRGLPASLHNQDEHEGQKQGNGVIDDKVQYTVLPASTPALLLCPGLKDAARDQQSLADMHICSCLLACVAPTFAVCLTRMIWQCMLIPAVGGLPQQIGHMQACDGMNKQKNRSTYITLQFLSPGTHAIALLHCL